MLRDPLLALVKRWERRAVEFTDKGNDSAAAECRRCAAKLQGVLDDLLAREIPYDGAVTLTGHALNTLTRRDLKNVGTRREPAFRLVDLPLKRIDLAASAAYLLAKRLGRIRAKSKESAAERRVRSRARRDARLA